MGKHGGTREGAGRKKGQKASHTLLAAKGREALIKAYLREVRPINEALINKAKQGDVQAIRELHDRVHGKAPQSIDISGEITKKVISIDE